MGVNNWKSWLKDNKSKIHGTVIMLDTNVLVSNYEILDQFIGNTVLIADVVLDELENLCESPPGLSRRRFTSTFIPRST